MPGKSEIMRAVCKSLNSLEILPSAPDGDWFPAIATKLCVLGRKFGFQVGAARVADENRDWPEWLYDVTWLEYEHEGERLLIEAPLVAECEWGKEGDIKDDFEKLLLARTGFPFDDLHRLQPGQVRGDRGAACQEGQGVQRLPC